MPWILEKYTWASNSIMREMMTWELLLYYSHHRCVCVFFCNFYITPYFSNTYSDETYLFFWFHRTDLTYIFSCSDSKINLMKIKHFCMLLNLMVNLLQPVLWWTVDSSILRNISKKADEETLEILVQ